MNSCDPFRAQLLDSLYDLLEADEARALAQHLDQCEGCRNALDLARHQQQLLSSAARKEFPGLRFEAAKANPSTHPLILPLHTVTGPAWVRWVVAAGLLLAVVSLGIPGGIFWHEETKVAWARDQYKNLTTEVAGLQNQHFNELKEAGKAVRAAQDEVQANLQQPDRELEAIQEEIRRLEAERDQQMNKVREEVNTKDLQMTLTGPPALQPGAPNPYQIRIIDRQNRQPPAEVAVTVQDKDKVVYRKKVTPQGGTYSFTLPRDLPLQAHNDLQLVVSATGEKSASQAELRETLSLAAPIYLTHLATDKPMYQPGDVVHFRSLTLERFSLTPIQDDLNLVYTLTNPLGGKETVLAGITRLVDSKDNGLILGPDQKPIRGIGAGDYQLPPDAKGGEYTLTISEVNNRFLPQERKFIVNQYEVHRLNKELEFDKKTYGPGETVVANCKATGAGNYPVAKQPVVAEVQIDGQRFGVDGKPGPNAVISTSTDDNGAVSIKFTLPAQMERGDGSLSVKFNDGGNVEAIVRSLPIVLKKLKVEFYPEGGDLVGGMPNRVYFQALTTLNKPAELTGRIVEEGGKALGDVHTLNDASNPGANQGMGLFTFTPVSGKKYALKIESPAGIEGKYPLPEVKNDGVVLTIPTGVTSDKEPIHVVLSSASQQSLLVGAYCRGRLLAHEQVEAKKGGTTEVDLKPESGIGGVYRVTVFEKEGTDGSNSHLVPIAERLVYRQPARRLDLAAHADKPSYDPGEKVKLTVQAVNEKDQPAAAVLMAAVVDKSVLKMADEKTWRSMPTHFFLMTEVRRPEDLEYADFLVGVHPKAREALDMLLGTQGWRRFSEQKDPAEFEKEHGQDATRMLVNTGRLTPALGVMTYNFAQEQVQNKDKELNENYLAKATPLMARLEQVEKKAVAAAILRQGNAPMVPPAASQATEGSPQPLPAEAGPVLAPPEAQRMLAELDPGFKQVEDRLAQADARRVEVEKDEARQAKIASLQHEAEILRQEYESSAVRLNTYKDWVQSFSTTALSVLALLLLLGCGFSLIGGWLRGKSSRAFSLVMASACCILLIGLVTTLVIGPGFILNLEPIAVTLPNQPAQLAINTPSKEDEAVTTSPTASTKGLAVPADKDDAKGGEDLRQWNMAPGGGLNEGRGIMGGMGGAPGNAQGRAWNKPNRLMLPPMAAMAPPMPGSGKGEARNFADGVQDRKAGENERGLPILDDRFDLGAIKARAPLAERDGDFQRREVLARRIAPMAKQQMMAKKRAMGLAKEVPALAMPEPLPFGQAGGGAGAGPGIMAGINQFKEEGLQMVNEQPPLPNPLPFLVREYAHQTSGNKDQIRDDQAETVYWNPVLVLPNGKVDVSFDLAGRVTTYQVLIAGNTLDGRLGTLITEIYSGKPVTVEPKLPIEVTANDKIDVPITIANDTKDGRLIDLHVQGSNLGLTGSQADEKVTVGAGQRVRRVYRFQPLLIEGQAGIKASGRSDPFNDQVERSFMVVPEGFPVVGAKSDLLEKNVPLGKDLVLPETWVKGTLKFQATVYPSTLADLQKGLEGLLREPNGCFEQTSTSNYPNLLILDYLKETDQDKQRPEIANQAHEMLGRGYQRLTSFECLNPGNNQHQGYEWFGGTAPPHEALTAYGLMQFRDMARVYDVDQGMVQRTQAYLMSRRDGKGGFQRNPLALDSFGRAPDNVTNAYIVWALTEGGKDDEISKELNTLVDQARSSIDPYFLALVANSLLNRNQADEAIKLLQKVAGVQKPDGHLDAGQTSITGSGGQDLQIETTALTLYGWLKANRPDLFAKNVQEAVQWIGRSRGGYGGFGSTQSTILALKALIAYARANKKTAEGGRLSLFLGEQEIAGKDFPAGAADALVLDLPDAEKFLKPGANDVRVAITGKNVFPYTATWSYRTVKPVADGKGLVGLTTSLDRVKASEGDTVHVKVQVENRSGQGQGMTVAIIGLPGGLTVPEDMKKLKDLTRLPNDGSRPALSAFELRGRELVLYWRDLPPNVTGDKKISLDIPLICRVPGEYRGPASRAYLYYNAEHKAWVEPLSVVITPQAN